MGALRLALYVEGAGETTGSISIPRAPGDPILEDAMGSAHLLVRRAIAVARSIPENAVLFDEPLRTRRGRLPKGSDLHDERTLVQLLTWPNPKRRPDLAIVIVDCDGEDRRRDRLVAATATVAVPHVIAVAVQEFEAWLLADHAAVAALMTVGPTFAGPPESLPTGQAKTLLAGWIARAGHNTHDARRSLAATCELGRVQAECRAFKEFMSELANVQV